jgi:tRNA uridine 5-carbamoylmethylation protein Kti12
MKRKAYILVGIPGSGKTTYHHDHLSGHSVKYGGYDAYVNKKKVHKYTSDDWYRLREKVYNDIRVVSGHGMWNTIVIDQTNTTAFALEYLMDHLWDKFDITFVLFMDSFNPDLCLEGVKNRKENKMDEGYFKGQAEKFAYIFEQIQTGAFGDAKIVEVSSEKKKKSFVF